MSPRQRRRWFHRYQHLYAWFFYMIMTLFWMMARDYLAAFDLPYHVQPTFREALRKHAVMLRVLGQG